MIATNTLVPAECNADTCVFRTSEEVLYMDALMEWGHQGPVRHANNLSAGQLSLQREEIFYKRPISLLGPRRATFHRGK